MTSFLLLLLASLFEPTLQSSPEATAPDPKPNQQNKETPLGFRSLEVTADGDRLHLLLGEFRGSQANPVLTHQVSRDGGQTWSNPVIINREVPPPHGLHRGSDARLAAHGNQIVAAWTQAGTDKWGSGPIVTVLSEDGGQTWIPGPNPSDDQRTDGHNFMALGADPSGGFHLAWLDSRDGERGLRYSLSKDGGKTWKTNTTAAPKTCECCWNSLVPIQKDSIAILYRARHPRDMRVVTSSNHGRSWDEPSTVGNFQWSMNACPHVGGALTTSSPHGGPLQRLHATVWTGATGFSGLYHLRSDDAGRTWSAPHKMNIPLAWHPHLAADAQGRVVAVWDTMAAVAGEVWAAVSSNAGDSWTEPKRLTPEASSGIFPRVVPTHDGFRVFWTSEPPGKPAFWTSTTLRP